MTVPTAAEILEGLRPWVEIESPTGHLEGLGRMMDVAGAAFADIGGHVERLPGRDGHGDHLRVLMPWGGAEGDAPGILVLSHLDTVHPVGTLAARLPWRIEGDRAFGPGIADMKSGAYIAYRALRTMAETGAHGALPVRFLLTSDEEVGSPTSRALIEEEAGRAKFVLVTEGARDGGKIVTGRKGVARYLIETTGVAAHSGVNHRDGRSAIAEMARQVLGVEAMTDYARGLTLSVGVIAGGTTENTVPDHCRATIDVRMETAADAAEVDARLKALAPVGEGTGVRVTGGLNRPPFEETPAIRALFGHAKGLAAEIGFELVGIRTGGGSDGNFTAARVATLDGLGPDGAKAHTAEEHIFVSSLVPRMTLLRRLFETLA